MNDKDDDHKSDVRYVVDKAGETLDRGTRRLSTALFAALVASVAGLALAFLCGIGLFLVCFALAVLSGGQISVPR